MVVEVNWLTLYQECRRAVFWASYCSSCTLQSFFPFWKISWLVMLMAVVPSPGVRVAVAESLIRDLGRVSEWCDLWGMKSNVSKTKTMIVSRSRTIHPVTPINYWRNCTEGVWWPCYFWSDIWFKDEFEKHLRSVSIAASQRLGILRKSWWVFHDRALLGRCFESFVLPVTFLIVDPWQSCVCFIRSGVTKCTLLMVLSLDSMCQRRLWSHIGRLMHHLAAEPCSIAGLLFPSRCPSGTILLTPYSMVWDWQVSRAGPMLLYWPKLLYPYYSLPHSFPFSLFCL